MKKKAWNGSSSQYNNQYKRRCSEGDVKMPVCHNCCAIGHTFKACDKPITSFGIIAFRSNGINKGLLRLPVPSFCDMCDKKMQSCIKIQSCKAYEQNSLLMLMVQRKDSMSYGDILRGAYDTKRNPDILKILVSELTCRERHRLQSLDFETNWNYMTSFLTYRHFAQKEYIRACAKWLQNSVDIKILLNDPSLHQHYPTSEFGFPKGRPEAYEEPLECAVREFCEEVGYQAKSLEILQCPPLIEEFRATNGIEYRHVYFLGTVKDSEGQPCYNRYDPKQADEIHNIGWFTVNEAESILRPYDIEKKRIIEEAKNAFFNLHRPLPTQDQPL